LACEINVQFVESEKQLNHKHYLIIMQYGIISHCFETTESVVHKARYKVVKCDDEIDN
jgi:hypothetical protein